MPDDDGAYYQSRADLELRHARIATHPTAVAAHHELALRYFELAKQMIGDRDEDQATPPQLG